MDSVFSTFSIKSLKLILVEERIEMAKVQDSDKIKVNLMLFINWGKSNNSKILKEIRKNKNKWVLALLKK